MRSSMPNRWKDCPATITPLPRPSRTLPTGSTMPRRSLPPPEPIPATGETGRSIPPPSTIQLPPFESFENRETYYSTRAHESTHWVGHKSRLNRSFDSKRFGDDGYAVEELVAELGAAFLCADLGITPEVMPEHAPNSMRGSRY